MLDRPLPCRATKPPSEICRTQKPFLTSCQGFTHRLLSVMITWRSYLWHYFSAVFCPWKPSEWRMGWGTTGGKVLRCELCGAAFGNCPHTGGPFIPETALDSRIKTIP